MVDESDLIDPLLLDNIQDGVKMLIKHISMRNQAVIIVD